MLQILTEGKSDSLHFYSIVKLAHPLRNGAVFRVGHRDGTTRRAAQPDGGGGEVKESVFGSSAGGGADSDVAGQDTGAGGGT